MRYSFYSILWDPCKGRGGGEGGLCGKERKGKRQSQALWAAECAESISPITFSSHYSPRRRRKRASEGERESEREEEGARALWLKRRGPAQSCHSLSNYNTTNNSAFSHSLLQITPLGCWLPVPSLLLHWRRTGGYVGPQWERRRSRWEGTFPGRRWQFLSHITRQTSKPTVVIWCDVDSNCLWCRGWARGRNGGAAAWPWSGSYGI